MLGSILQRAHNIQLSNHFAIVKYTDLMRLGTGELIREHSRVAAVGN